MAARGDGKRAMLGLVAGLVVGIVLTVVLALILRAAGVAEPWYIAAGITIALSIVYGVVAGRRGDAAR